MRSMILPALAVLTLAACAPMRVSESTKWVPSPNFDQRRPNFIILHHTTNATVERALQTLTDNRRQVSAHYLIGRDGQNYALVDEAHRAWHAGDSWWGGSSDLNSASIGIELDNTGDEPFAEAQINRLLVLLEELRARHRIPAENILGHGDVAPTRKVDPSKFFPWERLAASGFGLWCESNAIVPVSIGFDEQLALQALGYDVSSTEAARQAFRRHFMASDAHGELSEDELARLQCLVRKKARR